MPEKREREEAAAGSDDDSSDFGPMPAANPEAGAVKDPSKKKKKKRRLIAGKQQMLDELPCQDLYEKSYMHRDTVSQVLVSHPTLYVITCSIDGILKFWRKAPRDIIPVKDYRPHMGPFTASLSYDGNWLATRAHTADRTVKVFDVVNFDMASMIAISCAAGALEFIHSRDSPDAKLAVAEAVEPIVHIYNTRGEELSKHTLSHASRLTHLRFNPYAGACVSIDANGVIEYWSNETFTLPKEAVSFKRKFDTDLFALARDQVQATSLEISHDGSMFSIMGANKRVYIYKFVTGKHHRVYDETLDQFVELQRNGTDDKYKLDELDFGKRIATEKEMERFPGMIPPSNVVFDVTGNFVLYSTLLGVKVLNIRNNTLECVLGKLENTERFLSVALFQGKVEATQQMLQQLGQGVLAQSKLPDPTVFAIAWRRSRFYLLTRHEPNDVAADDTVGRDVFNEKPSSEDVALLSNTKAVSSTAVMRTNYGDIHLQLYPQECPKTVENFVGHCKSGYYNDVIFHRIIKGFMIQTGCPYGDGTGGESIWGGNFQDEFHPKLKHEKFVLSMANKGPATNGSQFFITTAPAEWLDNKHTVFGRVTKGADVVTAIENVPVIEKGAGKDKPKEPVRITNIELQ